MSHFACLVAMSEMAPSAGDETLFRAALIALYVMCPLTLLPLRSLAAPYGRHARRGWGPSLPAPIAWFLMESPTLWLTLLLYPLGRHRRNPLSLLPISLYLLHYFHRTLLYPLRLSSAKKSAAVPFLIAFVAFAFNILNGYLQSRSASHYVLYPPAAAAAADPLVWARVALGIAVFFWGMSVNIRSDRTLVRLKAEAGGGYKIPRGGWFELVSCPNYMGEALEWLGWAVVAWSPAAFGFFLYTCSNLGPRATAHHRWYLEKFGEEYPRARKAFIPYIL